MVVEMIEKMRVSVLVKHFGCGHFMIFCLLFSNAFSQIEVTPSSLDFGTTSVETTWVVDVRIANKGLNKDFLLRSTFSHEYEVLFTSKTIFPDSFIVMRIKFIPRLKGNFNENIELYFSSMSKPIIFPIRAFVEFRNPDDNIPCPDFSRLAADCCTDNMFIVEVVDYETGNPIERANVVILESAKERMRLMTGKDGRVTQTIPIGYYEMNISLPGYVSSKRESYINHRNAHFKFKLLRSNAIASDEIVEESNTKDSIISAFEKPYVEFSEELYMPNNFVFLLDVSSSMAQGQKLDLMKRALEELSYVLRPSDKITLLSYSDNAKVLLPTIRGDRKEEIHAIVNGIVVSGSTSGEKGFRAAYKILNREFIEHANNQLIVITDGVFQPTDQVMITKLVKKSVKKGLTTSVVGIQCASFAVSKLTDLSNTGNGSFLLIESKNDLRVLVEEMKKRSAK